MRGASPVPVAPPSPATTKTTLAPRTAFSMVWRTAIERPLAIEGGNFCSTGQSIKTFFPAPTSSKSFLSQETYANLSMRSGRLLGRETRLQPADPTPTATTESGFWSDMGGCSPRYKGVDLQPLQPKK